MLLVDLQVRSLRAVSDYKLLQSLPAPAHAVVSTSQGSDGNVFAASGTELWQLRPTPLLDQVCSYRPLHVVYQPPLVSACKGGVLLGKPDCGDGTSIYLGTRYHFCA